MGCPVPTSPVAGQRSPAVGGWHTAEASTRVSPSAAYVEGQAERCADTIFILGGYSPGRPGRRLTAAHVAELSDSLRDRGVLNALFGDPKLRLPEGESRWHRADGAWLAEFYAKACRGQELSDWRRDVPDCSTDNGSLGARKPFRTDPRRDQGPPDHRVHRPGPPPRGPATIRARDPLRHPPSSDPCAQRPSQQTAPHKSSPTADPPRPTSRHRHPHDPGNLRH